MSLWLLIVVPIALGLLTSETYGWFPALARAIVGVAAHLLPADDRDRYLEEWLEELRSIGGHGLFAVVWALSLIRFVAVRRLGPRVGFLVGLSLLVLDLGTVLLALHEPSSTSVGGGMVAWFFSTAVALMAGVLLTDPRLKRYGVVGFASVALASAALAEVLFLRVPSPTVTLGIRAGLALVALGLFAIAGWSYSHGKWAACFAGGVGWVAAGAAVAGVSELQAARLLSDVDAFWCLSSYFTGIGALLVAMTAPLLLARIDPTSDSQTCAVA